MTNEECSLVLTPEEVAGLLKVAVSDVETLIDKGDLRAFKVGTSWRVLATDFEAFISERVTADSQQVLAKNLLDPKTWVRRMSEDFKAQLRNKQYAEDSMGAWLKRAIA